MRQCQDSFDTASLINIMNSEFDIIRSLLIKDRSVRRFDQNKSISKAELEKLVELTRYCASGRNLQPLKYRIVHTPSECESVFPLLKWAGYLKDWDGPSEGERPVAYLIQCLDRNLTENCLCDDGIQLQALTLGASSLGIGGCIIKAFNPALLKERLKLDKRFEPLYVLALGYPLEKVVLEDLEGPENRKVEYYRTPDALHHVPKRTLEDLLI